MILDLYTEKKGHALILKKEHANDIYDLSERSVHNIFQLAKKRIKSITNKLKCDGFNIVQNNGKAAGQTVYHFHMHLIPRYVNDDQNINWIPRND